MTKSKIVGGPDRFEAVRSLLESGLMRKGCMFELESDEQMCVFMHSLQREDGSGHNFMFEAYIAGFDPMAMRKVTGFFNFTTRRGWLKEVTE